jgi:hypothetical protein
MRFQIVLPLASLILGVWLFHLGDLQGQRIIAAHGGVLEEPLQDGVAEARYVHYALNTPAWALLEDTRDKLWSRSTYWTGYDLHYFLAVTAMWFLIGLKFDGRSSKEGLDLVARKSRWSKILAWVYLLYGLFICYKLMSPPPHLVPLKSFLRWSFESVVNLYYGWWFLPIGLAWGAGMMLAGIYGLVHSNAPVEPRVANTT